MFRKVGFILFLFLISSIHHLKAQSYSLDSVLSLYEHHYEVKFSYDPELIGLVNTRFELTKDLDDLMRQIDEKLPFSVQNISDNYYGIVPVESSFSVLVTDSLSDQNIDPELITIGVNGKSLPLQHIDGSSIFSYKPNLKDTLLVYSLGYKPQTIAISDLINQKQLQVNLTYTSIRLSNVLIQDYLTEGINLNPSSQSINIAVEDLPLLPGDTDGDIFTSIAALPGVTSPDQRAGNLFIRGSFTDQNLILFDDIPIYHRGHYSGTISPYNAKIISDVRRAQQPIPNNKKKKKSQKSPIESVRLCF